jgi:hypothetical protein
MLRATRINMGTTAADATFPCDRSPVHQAGEGLPENTA